MSQTTSMDSTQLHNRRLKLQLGTIYSVSEALNRSLNLKSTFDEVLQILHDSASISHGMISLLDPDGCDLLVEAIYAPNHRPRASVSYRAGEGLVGRILAAGQSLVVERLADEVSFLDRLRLYDPELPFIGVPILAGHHGAVGVLTAQPPRENQFLLRERVQLMEMIANLIGNNVHLSWDVEQERNNLTNERDKLRRVIKQEYTFDNITGASPLMQRVFEQIRQVAKWDTTVLIRGQSGTGKELIASAIHYNSQRANEVFVKLNCAALPDNLLESELFGHEKGAFTGAVNQHKGRFEQADGGTLFLDEIGEISPAFQAKLLRVLQEGELQRVGGSKTIKVDVRIIAATNRDLEADVAAGEFREDLYYRLNVMPIQVPPLCDRLEDVPTLAETLVLRLAKRQERELQLKDCAVRLLIQYNWPGNVRELENCLERAAIMSEDGCIDHHAILLTGIVSSYQLPASHSVAQPVDINVPGLGERDRIVGALEQAGWVQAKAARLLGMTPRQVAYRIQIFNIPVRKM